MLFKYIHMKYNFDYSGEHGLPLKHFKKVAWNLGCFLS